MNSKKMSRRETLSAIGALSFLPLTCTNKKDNATFDSQPIVSTREFLEGMVLTPAIIDRFLDASKYNWAVFDPELGYRNSTSTRKGGIDGSYYIYTFAPAGERRQIHYAEMPCRLNTYGNSFTRCDQVNDGETWQEYLAAHLGEPVRNYGTGGHGVYQAYRRMLREEATSTSADNVILNIWSDDHRRSLMAARWLHQKGHRDRINRSGDMYFHNTPWCHVRIDSETGQLQEFENRYSTPESLYQLCDKDYIYNAFKDDIMVHVELAQMQGWAENLNAVKQLAEMLEMEADWSSRAATARSAERLFWTCGMKASEYIVQKTLSFAEQEHKQLLILLSYRNRDVVNACKGLPRFDQHFVDFLERNNIRFIDGLQKHVDDFAAFRLSPEDYVKRYYIGHYSPAGNHFFAFAIKDEIINWLDPTPGPYLPEGPAIEEYAG